MTRCSIEKTNSIKKKIFLTIAIVITFAVVSIQAQKIDSRLTSLLPTDEKAMNAKGAVPVQPLDTMALRK